MLAHYSVNDIAHYKDNDVAHLALNFWASFMPSVLGMRSIHEIGDSGWPRCTLPMTVGMRRRPLGHVARKLC